MRKFLWLLASVATLQSAYAANESLTVETKDWIVYYETARSATPTNMLSVLNSGSSCGGLLTLRANTSVDDVKELFHLITATKLSGTKIYVLHTGQPSCAVISFGPQ